MFDVQGSGARGSIENIGNIETLGIEFEVTRQLSDSIRLSLNYSRYRSEFDWNNDPIFDVVSTYLNNRGERELFNQPRTRANLGLDWVWQNWRGFISANYGGRASHNNTFALEGLRKLLVEEYFQFDFSLRYRVDKHLSLTLAANNLGADKNADPSGSSDSDSLGRNGLLQPSQTISLSIDYQF